LPLTSSGRGQEHAGIRFGSPRWPVHLTGNEDHGLLRVERHDALERRPAINARQAQVEDDDIGFVRVVEIQRLVAAGGQSHLIALGAQHLGQRFTDRRGVVHDQDAANFSDAVSVARSGGPFVGDGDRGGLSAGGVHKVASVPPALAKVV
jgi:hypothetical protein